MPPPVVGQTARRGARLPYIAHSFAHRRAFRWFALAVGLLLLVGCGTSGSSAGSPAGSAGAAAGSTTAPAGAAAAPTTGSSVASTTASSATASGTASGDLASGRALYVSNGCSACHGDQGQGGNLGPPIAGTGLTFSEALHQVRVPKGQMPAFNAQQISDAQVQQIYDYLESLGPPTPTPAPAAASSVVASGSGAASAPVDVDAIATAVNNLKVASDYAHDAAKTPADLKNYGGQAAAALAAAQAAVKAAIAAGGGSAELKADLGQLQQLLDGVAPDVQAAAAATSVAAAEPHTNKMVLASRLDLLPLALELVRVNGEVGSVTGTIKDTAGKPVPEALVTIEGGKIHTGLLTDANGAFKASGIAAFRSVEVKAYKGGYLYVESHAVVNKGGTANVVITIPQESNPPASPKVSNTAVPTGAIGGTATAHFSMTATQKDNNIAPDQLWALSPQAGVAYVLRSAGNNSYALDQPLPNLKAGSYTWYFFATTHDCDMSNVVQQTLTVQ